MSIKSLIKSSLRGKKLMFLSMGFMVVFVCVVGLNPVNAQGKRDTIKQKYPIVGIPEQEPEYPGGMQKCYEFLRENTEYPPAAYEARIQGTTQIRFVIKKDGEVDSVTVLRSSGSKVLDNEAVRVIESMPKWIPGKIAGKPVVSYYNLPIRFQIEVVGNHYSVKFQIETENNKSEKEFLKDTTYKEKADWEPEFPGEMKALYQFLTENTRYPSSAQEGNIEGTALVTFVIEKDGSITNVKIKRSSGFFILDEEALRVIRLMPKWIPGKVNGEPTVTSYYSISVRFQIDKPLKEKKNKK